MYLLLIILTHTYFLLPSETGGLSGKVFQKDDLNAYPGVVVELTQENKVISTTVTNVDGVFVFSNIPAGSYSLSLNFIRHWKKVIKNICIESNLIFELDIIYHNTCKNST